MGTTPACNDIRSMKLRPLRGTACIFSESITVPNWVLVDSTCTGWADTLICSFTDPTLSLKSAAKSWFTCRTMPD